MAQWSREDSLPKRDRHDMTNMDQHIHTGSPSSGVSKQWLPGLLPTLRGPELYPCPGRKSLESASFSANANECKAFYGRVPAKQELHPVGELLVEARITTPDPMKRGSQRGQSSTIWSYIHVCGCIIRVRNDV